ncbi:MAG: GNAT family N-acetyltransferase [Elusimicrobia bacterium]|nr:GNAT family N-acetyltransferase [Elusimicrobiota bacterium]
MTLRVVRSADGVLARRAAGLHLRALGYSSFITLFGEEFLFELYRSLLEDGLGFLLAAEEGDRLEGFILGSLEGSRLNQAIFRRPLRFGLLMLPTMLGRPSTIFHALQIALYGKRADRVGDPSAKAELVVIAVEESTRSKGLGARLVAELERVFRESGVSRYKVTCHEDMTRANAFYRKNGFELRGAFPLAGFVWNLYTKDVRSPPLTGGLDLGPL